MMDRYDMKMGTAESAEYERWTVRDLSMYAALFRQMLAYGKMQERADAADARAKELHEELCRKVFEESENAAEQAMVLFQIAVGMALTAIGCAESISIQMDLIDLAEGDER